ncbi:hypothetical protein [Microvirga rosea]|uniref:hypothetical protein n=1 Tax=Microvirga rosea TaxID=2715425 RepID=UPI001D0B1696|nr:hypothetical protein [Microvirga rosea]MCB8821920.1 hypothetical protein [Microvirga rosea]
MTQFLAADELKDACKFCATFARGKVQEQFSRGMIPNANDDTATVTFIEIEGKTYAVTANHVIEGFRAQAAAEGLDPEGYFLPKGSGRYLHPPFVQPPAAIPYARPDIALRPIDPQAVANLDKMIFKVEDITPTFPVAYAVAAGFPTTAKSGASSAPGSQLSMAGFSAVAEGVSSADGDQVQFYSEVASSRLAGDVSGMSGGPVFWSDGTNFGLLGFVKEAMADQSAASGLSSVHFICQRADYQTLADWANYTDRSFPQKRDALNARLAARNRTIS